jgi:hypothetical protein
VIEGGYSGTSAGGRVIAAGATDDGQTNLQAGTAKFTSLSLTAQDYSVCNWIQSPTPNSSNAPMTLSSQSSLGMTVVGNNLFCSTAGRYLVTVVEGYAAMQSSIKEAYVRFNKNGSLVWTIPAYNVSSVNGVVSLVKESRIIDAIAGDYFSASTDYFGSTQPQQLQVYILKVN